jgi:hypothetical protein
VACDAHAASVGAVTPDEMIEKVVIIIEERAPRRYVPPMATLEPLLASEYDAIRDAIVALCAKNRPREASE